MLLRFVVTMDNGFRPTFDFEQTLEDAATEKVVGLDEGENARSGYDEIEP